MTRPTNLNRVDHTGTGAIVPIPYTFPIEEDADLVVTQRDLNGAETTKTLTTDYTVTGAGLLTGGYVTPTAAVTSGYVWTIRRVRDITQETDIRNQGAYYPEVIEDALDKLTDIAQQHDEEFDRCFQAAVTDSLSSYALPALTGQEGYALGVVSGPALGLVANNAVSFAADLASTSDVAKGDAMLGVKYALTGALGRTQHNVNEERISVTGFTGADPTGATDSTAAFQSAIDSHRKIFVPPGEYAITAVAVPIEGADIELDDFATLVVSGAGINRNISQVTRATYLAAHGLVDDYNLYGTLRIRGGNIVVGSGAVGVSDRIPFLAYIGVAPTPTNPGLQPLKVPLHVEGVSFVLNHSTAKGVGIHGGWGSIVKNSVFSGYDWGVGITIGGDGTYDVSCHPQLISISKNQFNSCTPIETVKGTCTNSCEALVVTGNKFNFVQAMVFNTVNGLNYSNNFFVSSYHSMRLVDSGNAVITDSYFQVAYNGADADNDCILKATNSKSIIVSDNTFIRNAGCTTRNIIGFATNSSNAYEDITVHHLRIDCLDGPYVSAVNFTASSSQIFNNVSINDIHSNGCLYIINLFGASNGNTGFMVSNLWPKIGDGCTHYIQAMSRLTLSTCRLPQFYESLPLSMVGTSNSSGLAEECNRYSMEHQVRSANYTVGVSGYANVTNSSNLSAAKNGNSISVRLFQASGLGGANKVEATALLEIDGSAV